MRQPALSSHRLMDAQKYAHEIILECHEAWKRLISGQVPSENSLCVQLTLLAGSGLLAERTHSLNVTVNGSAGKVENNSQEYRAIPQDSRKPPAPIDASIDKVRVVSVLLVPVLLIRLHSGSISACVSALTPMGRFDD